MPRQWMLICAQLAVLASALFGYISAAPNHYGTISVVGPAFVNREVTLKATPFYPWGCHVEWKYIIDGQTQVQTMDADFATRYSADESFFLKWKATVAYNKSVFYAVCSTNTSIRTNIVSLNMTDIVGKCGTLVLLNQVVQGEDVKLGYFPSDLSIWYETSLRRTWIKNSKELKLREGYNVEEELSAYLYTLTVLNFDKKDEGSYVLVCNATATTESVQLYILERPSYPVLGPKSPDFNTTECIYVYGGSDLYCKTENGTNPVQVELKLDQNSFVLAESKEIKGLYRFHDLYQQMAGLSRQNVTCLVSNPALETPYDVHGILCNVEKGTRPVITVPEFLDGESSTTVCEVHNAFPAPAIEIRVGTFLLADVQQTDSFNISSNTFTSRAKATKTNKTWNGKQMCCTSKHDFGLTKIPICKNISIKYPPSDLSIYVDKKHIYSNNVSVYILNMFCETDASNPPCTIEWESDNDNLRYVHINKWTDRENGSFRSVANVLYNVTKDMAGVTITCSTICDHFPSHLNASYAISFSGSQTFGNDNQTFSSTSRYPIDKVLLGTGVSCGFCILFIIGIGRYVLLKRRKVNAINTIEIVENHSDTSSDNGMLHIATEGVQYAVVHRQAATRWTETQQPHDDDSLTYAELNIKFLQEANARVLTKTKNTPTEYAELTFASTQKSA
ncbi:uncharacterized protein LOC128233951 [Mya arenaria]|uniref:uncharacterized protein LOC128233951 n=1 Tax=Mya arenaria TaxID=6604 RepID=UPI0022E3C8B1|nr:uncharacterized protein LOC128233951 [Mya arenaria]